MFKRPLNPFVLILIVLGVIGVVMNLQAATSRVVTTLLLFGGIFLVYKLVIGMRQRGSTTTGDKSGYKRAVKQSQQKYKAKTAPKPPVQVPKKKEVKKKKRPSHLTVIDGEKEREKKGSVSG